MDYDVIIIGAGMSGLAAGIRLAYFGRRVCIVERHYAYGGLNSYYKLDGREYDVGLHALTNYVPPGTRGAPLTKLLRQLRFRHEDFELCQQFGSEIHFPSRRLRFTNDVAVLLREVEEKFPSGAAGFNRLVADVGAYDDTRIEQTYCSTRKTLATYLDEPLLIDMLLCPIMYYGSAEPDDMDFTQFCTMFKSLFLEGFARPTRGVRTIIKALVRKYRACGGKLRMNAGVRHIETHDGAVSAVELENGGRLTTGIVISSAGYHETLRLCGDVAPGADMARQGEISFVETVFVLDRKPADFGHLKTIVFYNDGDSFHYRRPRGRPVDTASGVVCCSNNYEHHSHLTEGVFRLTWLADYETWMNYDEDAYRHAKSTCLEQAIEKAEQYLPGMRRHVIAHDMFTPRTIRYYTGHLNGAVYGAPRKVRDGRTPVANLYLCGTDQGFLGIIGAMLSGITIANLHVLSAD